MYSISEIEDVVCNVVKSVAGIEAVSRTENLLSRKLNIHPAKFLYIFNELQQELQLLVCEIFKGQAYTLMTIENLASALFELQGANPEVETRT